MSECPSQKLDKKGCPTQKGDRVRFRVSDAFLPEAEELRGLGSLDESVEGTIMNFSDSGFHTDYFAVVDVIKRHAVVVPIERLELISKDHTHPPDQWKR